METDGIFQSQEEIDNANVVQAGAKVGDIRYKDQNGDGVISFNDDSDRTDLGSAIPDFTFGFNVGAEYKNFDFSMNVFSAVGQQIIRNYERQQPYANQLDYVIDRWVGTGTSNENPRLTTEANRNGEFSDYYVENGAFVRIKNIQIGYTLPENITKKLKSTSIRFYVAVNNLLTVTKYRGFDPEIGSVGGALAAGVDYGLSLIHI